MDPNKKTNPQDKPMDSVPDEKTKEPESTWLEDMKDDLEDYMEEQGSHLRY